MKRTLALIITAAMLLGLCACGATTPVKEDPAEKVYSVGF